MPTSHTLAPEIATLHPDVFTVEYWKAAKEHRLIAPKCTNCGTFRFPPAGFCHECRHQDVEWIELSGHGTIYSFTVTRQALIPQLAPYVPYVVAVIEPDDAPGIRIVSNIVEVDPAEVKIGARVRVQWDDIHSGTTIPRFSLVAG